MSRESTSLFGYVDVVRMSKDGKVIQHVAAKNKITELYGRFLLSGNLTHPAAVESGKRVYNHISRLLGSTETVSTTDAEVIQGTDRNGQVRYYISDPNEKQGFQIVRATCSDTDGENREDGFSLYCLSIPVSIDYDTVFPPFLEPDLATERIDEVNGRKVIQLKGNATTSEYTSGVLELDKSFCKWSTIKHNPAYKTAYVCKKGTGYVQSLVLCADREAGSSCITYRQSPSEMGEGWDTAWRNAWLNTSKKDTVAIVDDAQVNRYLLCPFTRIYSCDERLNIHEYLEKGTLGYLGGGKRYTDAIYTINSSESDEAVSFYELGTGMYYENTSVGTALNRMTDEKYSAAPSCFVATDVSGGFAIGRGKALRINQDSFVRDANQEYIGRIVTLSFQDTLNSTGTPTVYTYNLETLYATDGTKIPSTIVAYNKPVMVAKRVDSCTYSGGELHDTDNDDVVEVFVSLGAGTFTEYTDDNGMLHPGGEGIELHKVVIHVDELRKTESQLDTTFTANSDLIEYKGRVAVLPFAVGFRWDDDVENNHYVVGTYDYPFDEYRFPITHILRGMSPMTWEYDNTVTNAIEPVLCATNEMQPGIVAYGIDFSFVRCILLGVGDTRLAYMSTADGYLPLAVNRRQRWATNFGYVMSAVTLPEPVYKAEDEILVVYYSYGFSITDECLELPSISTGLLDTDDAVVSVKVESNTVNPVTVAVYRSKDVFGNELQCVYSPSMSSPVTFEDADVERGVSYVYSARSMMLPFVSEMVHSDITIPYVRGAIGARFVLGALRGTEQQAGDIVVDTGSWSVVYTKGDLGSRYYYSVYADNGVQLEKTTPVLEFYEAPGDKTKYKDGVLVVDIVNRVLYYYISGIFHKLDIGGMICTTASPS